MCGIIGYVGDDPALSVLIDGLERLSYRGYDSAGIALLGEGGLRSYRAPGKLERLREVLPTTAPATVGMGHTRWSTHGPPTAANAHPQLDCTEEIAVVHNGVISNAAALRSDLEGHTFTSETDTELIAHLLEEATTAGGSRTSQIAAVTQQLAGSYALVIAYAGDDHLYAVRQQSPLVVGEGDRGSYIASDVPAFIEHTDAVRYLEDGDIAVVGPASVSVTNDEQRVSRSLHRIAWDPEVAEKGGFAHYMLKEIIEQPDAMRQSLSGRMDPSTGTVRFETDLGPLSGVGSVVLVGCGTSHYAASYAAAVIEATGIPAEAVVASEFRERPHWDPASTLIIAVTQSGETADTLTAMRAAVGRGYGTLAVTNTVGSSITRLADRAVFIRAGPEIGVAATKTFSTQVATLLLVGVALGEATGAQSRGSRRRQLAAIDALPGQLQAMLDARAAIDEIAAMAAGASNHVFIGRALGLPVAREGALKLKEISYAHAEAFPAGELKHGPLALVTDATVVYAMLMPGADPARTVTNVKEVQARGATVVAIGPADRWRSLTDWGVAVDAAETTAPLLSTLSLQLIAYEIAAAAGRDIDQPRNLAKSVTVE
ncbi:MAG: glutamine--fructose-6-phosphate transaminase (isomerizing) [Haloquadratum sp.]|nr:glutamine--fructose-6-phosphate transaminase (isomerizing) [Haloferacaceae archaeon]MDR9445111.1 glutamine--fructose-6-phosphate transaminase (isomerizing) [Haloquadratum sp.]